MTFKNISSDAVNLRIDSKIDYSLNKTVSVYQRSFTPFVIGYIPTTPPFPIIVVPKLEIVAGIQGNISMNTSVKINQNASLTLGLSYDNGKWTPIKDFSNDFTPEFSFITVNSVKAYLGPKLDLLLYGVAGPYASLDAYLKLYSTQNSWSFYGGLEAFLGVKGEILGKNLFDYNTQVLSYEKLIANGVNSNTMPFADFSINPREGTTSTEFKFDASPSSDHQDPLGDLLFRWDWEDDLIFDTGWSSNYLASHKYSFPRKYDVTLQVKDKGGLIGEVNKFGWITVQ